MPVTRRMLELTDENQILKAEWPGRFVVNTDKDWQMLIGPKAALSTIQADLETTAQFDTTTFTKIKLLAVLYPTNRAGGAYAMSSVTFSVAVVFGPQWTETDVVTTSGTMLANGHWYAEVDISSLVGANMDGDTTLEIEAIGVRQNRVFRKTAYINHLGIYDTTTRLKQDVEWLDLSKLDE